MALHLVAPLGFTIDNAKLKRAGLDYWDYVSFRVHDSIQDFGSYFNALPDPKRLFGFSKFATRHYAASTTTSGNGSSSPVVVGTAYRKGDWLMFGAETTGLPQEAVDLSVHSGGCLVKIPMNNYKYVRSLNLATSVGIGVFEAIRQLDGAVLPEDVEGEEELDREMGAQEVEVVEG
jgi:tRNA (cytidine/uridine-2'-O-)-methyltransferase